MRHFIFFALLAFLSSCSTREYHNEWISEVKHGQTIPDLRPVPKGSTDLREFALSLPILEGRDTDSINWFYEMSEPAPTQQIWELPVDGAQGAATIRRLPNHSDGQQQIELECSTVPDGVPMTSDITRAKLRRTENGWLVLKSKTTPRAY